MKTTDSPHCYGCRHLVELHDPIERHSHYSCFLTPGLLTGMVSLFGHAPPIRCEAFCPLPGFLTDN